MQQKQKTLTSRNTCLRQKPGTSARCQKVHRMIRAQRMLNTKNNDWPFTVGVISIPLSGPQFPTFSKNQLILSEEINI